MPSVSIRRIDDLEKVPSLLEAMTSLANEIERRAFELCQQRGSVSGSAIDDWLQAEQEFVCSPQSELVERDRDFLITVAAPGLEAKDVQVSALPDAIIVQAENRRRQETVEGTVHFSEFSERNLFRRLTLPSRIDIEQVRASLENGVLRIVAAKAAEVPQKKVAVAAG